MLRRNELSRGFTRLLALAALLGLGFAARTASAWTYPLLPHVQGLAFFPERPNDAQRTGFLLSAVYPDSCWQLVDARLPDSAHVYIAIAPATTCRDSGSTWTAGWDLGLLVAGMHTLTVHASVQYNPYYAREEEITVPFEVSVGAPPPPPPPPPGPPIDSVTTLVNYIEITPGAPQLGDRVAVRFRGRYPFDCGTLADASSADPANLSLTLATTPECGDTSRVWDTSFDLGVPTAGDHFSLLHLHVPSLAMEREQGFAYHVTDPNAPPPPPPPPIDSLEAGLSASAPNPFSDRTTFAVSLADPTLTEVAVFDLGGRRVTTIHRGMLPRGTSNLAWDGRRQDGSRAAGGIYFYRLTLPTRVVTRRVVLLGAP
jgi:hypothetical protein